MIRENKHYPRPLIGRLIGPLILKQVLKTPGFSKNSPTVPELRITEVAIDFSFERDQMIELLGKYTTYQMAGLQFYSSLFWQNDPAADRTIRL